MLQKPHGFEADMAFAAHDNMVMYGDAHRVEGVLDHAGHIDIRLGGGGVAAGMVVRYDGDPNLDGQK